MTGVTGIGRASWAVFLAPCLLLLLAGAGWASAPPKEGDPVPDLALRDLAGVSHTIAQMKGRAVAFCFFRAEQDKSIKALNDLARVYGAFRDRSLFVFAVAVPGEDSLDAIRALQGKLGLAYPVLLDEGRKLSGTLGVAVFPTTVLLDPEGRVALTYPSYAGDFDKILTQRIRDVLGMTGDGGAVWPARAENGVAPGAREADRDLMLAQILYQRGFPARALPEAEKALQKDPSLVDAHLLLGRILLDGGKPETARSHFEEVLARRPDLPEARVGLGIAFLMSGDLDRAEAELVRAVSPNPSPGEALFHLGQVYEKRGQTALALETYRRACEELVKRMGRND
jgi:Tfp pilus assembly protein PilF/peroxiredoxin